MTSDNWIDPNIDHDYNGEQDLQKIIAMLEDIPLKMGWDANISPGAGDSAWGDIRIPAKHVRGFVELLKSIRQSRIGFSSSEIIKLAENDWHCREERRNLHPKIPWTQGWITGFLTPHKPDWNKVLYQQAYDKGAKEEREKIYSWIKETFWIHDEPEYTHEEWIKQILDHLRIDQSEKREPKCIRNHHGDSGSLIVYMGSQEPCLGCDAREECFKIYYEWKRQEDALK